MIGTKTFALAEALVFAHGSNARAEAERHLLLMASNAETAKSHLWEDVVHVLPIAVDRVSRFPVIAQDSISTEQIAVC
jgi:hypothetical protein